MYAAGRKKRPEGTHLSRISWATSEVTVAGLGIGASETAASSAAFRLAPLPVASLYKHSRLYLQRASR